MEQENEYLKERVIFLESLLELQEKSLEKLQETNKLLMDYLKSQDSDKNCSAKSTS